MRHTEIAQAFVPHLIGRVRDVSEVGSPLTCPFVRQRDLVFHLPSLAQHLPELALSDVEQLLGCLRVRQVIVAAGDQRLKCYRLSAADVDSLLCMAQESRSFDSVRQEARYRATEARQAVVAKLFACYVWKHAQHVSAVAEGGTVFTRPSNVIFDFAAVLRDLEVSRPELSAMSTRFGARRVHIRRGSFRKNFTCIGQHRMTDLLSVDSYRTFGDLHRRAKSRQAGRPKQSKRFESTLS